MDPTEALRTLHGALDFPRALPYETRLPVLGVPVRFDSDDPLVIAAIESAYASRDVTGPDARAHVRIVHDTGRTLPHADPGSSSAQMTTRSPAAGTVLLHAADFTAFSDSFAHRAGALVGPHVLHDAARFVTTLLDTLTLFAIARLERLPLHAAVLRADDAVLLLAGPSGTGKSTLAYAAARAGIQVLTDDVAYVQIEPALRIWTRPGPLHLLPDAVLHFPELEDLPLELRPNGKRKVAVAVQVDSPMPDPPTRAGIAILTRSERARPPERLDVETATRELTRNLDPGFHLFADTIGARVRRVAAGGAWRVYVSGDPSALVPDLRTLLRKIAIAHPSA